MALKMAHWLQAFVTKNKEVILIPGTHTEER